jgi:hypothetical protein
LENTSSIPAQDILKLPQVISADKPVDIILIEEGLDARGQWYQRFDVVIGPGGTMADAAIVVYGDERRASDLLEIVKRRYPSIDVRRIPVGLRIEIIVDPTVAFVLRDSRREGDWEIRNYFNGAMERRRVNARVVKLPEDKPGKEFAIPGDTSDRPVPAGARLLEYQYRASETFEQAVGLIYEEQSVAAMRHFITQTTFDQNNWPPPPLDKLRVVVMKDTDLQDHQISEVERPFPGEKPVAVEAQLDEQRENRRQSGIYAIAHSPYFTTYRIRIASARTSARQIASLIYNNADRWKDVASAAQVELPTDDPPPDVRLQGRDFLLQVAYEDEGFLLADPNLDATQNTRVRQLLNGTEITTVTKGPNLHVLLPTGYRKAIYQPVDLVIALARIKAGIWGENEEAIVQFIWDWDPGSPRRSGDVLQTAAIKTRRGQTVIEVTVQPRPNVGDIVGIVRRWAPYAFAVVAISFGLVLILLAGRSGAPKPYRRRW